MPISHAKVGHRQAIFAVVLQWYRRYKSTVECEYRRWHSVAVTRAVVDMSAKSLLMERIVLEAKRLLAHSTSLVAAIAADLGFDEATNFVKVFRHGRA